MDASLDLDGGWKEAITNVSDLDKWCDLADRVCGWTMAHRGAVDSRALKAWNLSSNVTGEEALFHCGDEAQGFVRFIKLGGVEAPLRIRAGAASWETGGIFSLMVRSKDLNKVHRAALDAGWTSIADPVSFEYGGRILSNVILRGPDGVCFGMYERVQPPLEGWDHIRMISQPFNCMQIVRDRNASHDFHRDALGFTAYVYNSHTSPEPKESQFGHPRNMTTEIKTHAAIMHPRGIPDEPERQNGRVELIQWDGIEGRDLASRAQIPNLGHIGLRWAVADVEASAKRISDAGFALTSEPTPASLAPYGEVIMCGVLTPDGVLYELFQPA